MITRLFLQAHRSPVLTPAQANALEGAVGRTAEFAARRTIVRPNEPLTQCTLLLDGIVQRYKDTPEGRRQILAIHVPGDFVDLHSYPLKHLEHHVAAITPVQVALFPHAAIRALTEQSATLTELLWRSTLIDAAINREWIVSVGARGAAVRIANMFCEMYLRLDRVGLAEGLRFGLPLTQIDLADATGLTPVHANRMLRQLREQGLVEFRQGIVEIFDWTALKRFAEFDASYLYLD
ncbi:Crp/Fnr family transcriptional regulator [soil metagenome]